MERDDNERLDPGERAAQMAEERGRMVRELTARRQAAGLSQTEVAALMGTSQSAVARLESGSADVRASTLERYAAAIGGQIAWRPQMIDPRTRFDPRPDPSEPWRPGWTPPSLPGWAPPGSPQVPGAEGIRVWPDPQADWQVKLQERLLAKRIVMATGVVDDAAAARLSAQLLALNADGDQPVRLELQNLHAELGAVITVMGILDVMRVPVHGCVSGELGGPAIGLLACCTTRSAYPNAALTLSEPRAHLTGTATALSAREQQFQRMLDTIYFKLAEVTGRSAEEIREDARQGRVFTAAQAIGYGLLDRQEAPGQQPSPEQRD
jgi:ATP-dependent Clp protease protease subunit